MSQPETAVLKLVARSEPYRLLHHSFGLSNMSTIRTLSRLRADELALRVNDTRQRCLTHLIAAQELVVGDAQADRTDKLSLLVAMLRASRDSLDVTRAELSSLPPDGCAARPNRAVWPRRGLKRGSESGEHGASAADKADLRIVGQDWLFVLSLWVPRGDCELL